MVATAASLLAQSETLFDRLSPLNGLRVIMGLVVVLILGGVIFMVIRAGAHMLLGYAAAAKRLPRTSLPDENDWANRPLNSPTEQDD